MTEDLSIEHIAATFGPMFRRVARAHESDPRLAEELTQEMLLAIWRALPSWRRKAPLQAFLARIALNVAVDHVRRALRRGRAGELSLDFPDPGAGPEQVVMAQDEGARLVRAVQQLPLAYREVALLTLEGLTAADVADVLGISANAVALRLSRAKSILRQQLGASR